VFKFFSSGVFIGEGAMSEVGPGGLTPGWRGPGPGRVSPVWGPCGPPPTLLRISGSFRVK
jgi:hypothetical protein